MEREQSRVLVVDDEPVMANLMRDFLRADGFQVRTASSATEALAALEAAPVDCLLLDVMLPGQSGFDLCSRIRETSDVPILFLSALDGDMDKIRGLGLGGDDYIAKSATPAEVVARVKAVLRRARSHAPSQTTGAILDFGRFVLDLRAHEVRVGGAPIAFTAREFELLTFLASHPRQVFTREQLFARFWGSIGDRHTVTVHIGRIREKIEAFPDEPRYIVTIWGVGYRFEQAPQ
ncbi:MAG: response regulator transcription factor [Ktedonobacterales bacterium]